MDQPSSASHIIVGCSKALQDLRRGRVPTDILALVPESDCPPEIKSLLADTQALVAAYAEGEAFILALAKGDIFVEAPRKNLLISAHKELQSALRNLVWQIQQVADGNYHQRIDFLGKFSDAFNCMVTALAEKQTIERELAAGEERSRRAEAVAGFGNWEVHLTDSSVHGSPGVFRIYGLPKNGYSLEQMLDMTLPPYREKIETALHKLITQGAPYDIEYKITRADTSDIIDIHSIAEYDRDKQIVFGVIQDITVRKRAEELLDYQHRFQKMIADISAQFLDSTQDNLDEKISRMLQATGEFFAVDRVYLFQFSPDGQFMNNTHEWCSTGVEEQLARMQNLPVDSFPWWAEQIRSNACVYIHDVDALPDEALPEKQEFQSQGIKTILCVPITNDNQVIGLFGFDSVHARRAWSENEISFFRIAANTVSSALQKYRLEQELIKLSISDQLTGLYNRRHLYNCMTPLVEEYRRSRKPFAVLFFDIDYFKRFNDTHGHFAGDFILQHCAALLKDNIRPFDIACRYGGEEFVVLAKNVGSLMAQTMAERLLAKARSSQYAYEGRLLSFTLSCGIAVIDELSDETLYAETLIDMADRRLYLAKQTGRNRCVWVDISP